MTLRYCFEQDRLYLSGENECGQTIKLWLTLRLLSKLVPNLLLRLHGENSVPSNMPDLSSDDSESKKHSDDTSVLCAPGSPEALVTSIVLEFATDHLILIFKDAASAELASLALSTDSLLIWTRGLQKCFETAGWPLAAFVPKGAESIVRTAEAVTIH